MRNVMVDYLRAAVIFGADRWLFDDYIRELSANVRIKKVFKNKKYEVYTGKVYKDFDAVEASDKTEMKAQAKMKLIITYYYKDSLVKIKFGNSFRKWYYGVDSVQDFCKTDFLAGLKLLMQKLCLGMDIIRDFDNYRIELGVTNEHEPNFALFNLSVIDHRNLKDVMRINTDTVTHMGDNLNVSCYNKGAEIKKRRKSNKILELKDGVYYLRSEVNIKKVSGVKFANDKCRTIGDLLDNWEENYDYLIKELKYIKFIDCISPKVVDHILLSQKLSKGDKNKNKEFHDLIKFLGLEHIGWDKFRDMAHTFTAKPSSIINDYGDLETKFRLLQNPTYKQLYFDKLKEKKKEVMM